MERPNVDVPVSVVVLAYGAEPLLEECVQSVLSSTGVQPEVLLVDNGAAGDEVDRLEGLPGLRVLRPGENTGFAGGCNLGAAAATSDLIAFVNSDAVVRPDALAALARTCADPAVGLASASLRLYDQPEVMNSAGNPVHYLGVSWAGGLGEPASEHARATTITSVTGAAVMCRRETWERLGGFCAEMFAYCEDAELSLRTWQLGLQVRYVPDAVVLHHYEFSRNDLKMYLLERNRLFLLLTLYERRTLLALLPALLGLELAVLALSVAQGWWRQKVRGWWWLVRNRSTVRSRRQQVQAARRVPDRDLLHLFTARFEPGAESGMRTPPVLDAGSRFYWKIVRQIVR
jgi:GT2 family glycosyltransferase